MLITLLTFAICISILVFVHELGHYTAAKLVGVEVRKFSIGFPPQVYSKKVGQTEWMIGAVPLGGFVDIKGLDFDEEDANDPTNYGSKKPWQKFLILVSGALMNLVVAFILMPLIYLIGVGQPIHQTKPITLYSVEYGSAANMAGMQPGDTIIAVDGQEVQDYLETYQAIQAHEGDLLRLAIYREGALLEANLDFQLVQEQKTLGFEEVIPPVIGKITPSSPAFDAGLQVGDRIMAIGQMSIENWHQIKASLQNTTGKIQITYERAGAIQQVELTPQDEPKSGSRILGIMPPMEEKSYGLGESIRIGGEKVLYLSQATLEFLWELIAGKADTDSMGGPVMIAKAMGDAAKTSAADLLGLMSFISIQLFIINLLPFPALDGGHIFLLMIEKIRGKALSSDFRYRLQKLGFSFLMVLILFITIKDILKLFGN